MRLIHIGKDAVPVNEAVYRAYWQEKERERYQDRRAHASTWSVSDLAAQGIPEECWFAPHPSAEEESLAKEGHRRLYEALATLAPEEEEFIWRLVLGECTERAMAEELNLSRSAVHKRRRKILQKIKETLVLRS